MQDPNTFQLPYLLRDMLRFEYGARVELIIFSRAFTLGTISIVGATREGLFTYNHTTTLSDSGTTQRFSLSDVPIWVSVIDKNEEFKQGNLFVKLDLALNGDKLHAFFSGYVYGYKSLTWPPINAEIAEPTRGQLDTTDSADPAAGAQLTYTIADGEAWRIVGIIFTLVTDANVANRRVHIKFDMKQAGAFDCFCSINQTAGTTRKYHCIPIGAGLTESDDNDIIIPIPDNLILCGESKITTETTNRQAGDNFGAMTIIRERFITAKN